MDQLSVLAQEVIDICVKKELRLGLIETSTGGFVSHLLTNVEGASRAFGGSFILYSAQSKHLVLGIPLETIQEEGQISEKMIDLMLQKMDRYSLNIAVAITGIAGRSIEGIPRGQTFIGVNYVGKIIIKNFKFSGTRQDIKDQSAEEAFKMVIEILQE
jgi:PncC family amidohydrolase